MTEALILNYLLLVARESLCQKRIANANEGSVQFLVSHLSAQRRTELPEVSEIDAIRHFTRLRG